MRHEHRRDVESRHTTEVETGRYELASRASCAWRLLQWSVDDGVLAHSSQLAGLRPRVRHTAQPSSDDVELHLAYPTATTLLLPPPGAAMLRITARTLHAQQPRQVLAHTFPHLHQQPILIIIVEVVVVAVAVAVVVKITIITPTAPVTGSSKLPASLGQPRPSLSIPDSSLLAPSRRLFLSSHISVCVS